MRIIQFRNAFIQIGIYLFVTVFVACCQKEHVPELPEKDFIDNGIIRLGVDLTLGGAITFLSDSKTKENLINNYDWGRQIQMSFYGGPNPFTPKAKSQILNGNF